MPCDRPIITVSLCSNARLLITESNLCTSSIIRSAASLRRRAILVSRISDEVSPQWINRASGPTFSATLVKKAITSCFVSFSISSMRATEKDAFFFITCKASLGITPSLDQASQANISTLNQVRYLFSSDHIRAISGRAYRSIISSSLHPEPYYQKINHSAQRNNTVLIDHLARVL